MWKGFEVRAVLSCCDWENHMVRCESNLQLLRAVPGWQLVRKLRLQSYIPQELNSDNNKNVFKSRFFRRFVTRWGHSKPTSALWFSEQGTQPCCAWFLTYGNCEMNFVVYASKFMVICYTAIEDMEICPNILLSFFFKSQKTIHGSTKICAYILCYFSNIF